MDELAQNATRVKNAWSSLLARRLTHICTASGLVPERLGSSTRSHPPCLIFFPSFDSNSFLCIWQARTQNRSALSGTTCGQKPSLHQSMAHTSQSFFACFGCPAPSLTFVAEPAPTPALGCASAERRVAERSAKATVCSSRSICTAAISPTGDASPAKPMAAGEGASSESEWV